MKRRNLALIALTPVALLTVGCATPTPDAQASASPRPLTTLSSGDALGRSLFSEPIALAPATRQPAFAEVPSR